MAIKRLLTIVMLAVMVFVLAACGSGQAPAPTDATYVAEATPTPEPTPTPTPTPAPEPVPTPDIVPYSDDLPEYFPEPEMTAFGRQVAEDFLMQFPSIFFTDCRYTSWFSPNDAANTHIYFPFPRQHGRETDDGRFRVWDSNLGQSVYSDERLFHIGYQLGREPILTEQASDIFFRDFEDWRRQGFYDSNLNRIESANWMLHGVQYATDFVLWDFDQDGIPEIEIQYWGSWVGLWPTSPNNSLFVFDGYEYRRVAPSENEEIRAWREENHRDRYEWYYVNNLFYNMILDNLAFLDPNGNLIFMPRHFDEEYVAYHYVIFEGNTVDFRPIISILPEEAPSRWYHEAHYMPGTDILLTPIHSLSELRAEMFETIRQRLINTN